MLFKHHNMITDELGISRYTPSVYLKRSLVDPVMSDDYANQSIIMRATLAIMKMIPKIKSINA